MRYVVARHNDEMRDMTYRIFISDELFIMNNNLVQYIGGSKMEKRYYDVVFPEPEETRTAEEIIEGLKKKLGELK